VIAGEVAVAPGGGILARRSDALVFAATTAGADWPALIAEFAAADDGALAIDVLTTAAAAAGFAIDPFVAVAWWPEVLVIGVGDLAVCSDIPAMPALTGAGSATWVERRPVVGGECAVWAGAAACAGTDLRSGLVPAGGFRLLLTPGETPSRAAATTTTAAAPLRRRQLQARRCRRDHLSPTHALVCRVCRDALDPLSPVEVVEQPPLAVVLVPAGDDVVLDRAVVLGRNPDPAIGGGDAATVTLGAGKDVSRSHAIIRPNGWTIEVVDCDSASRTIIASPSAADPIVLDPWAPCEAAVGDVVYLGGHTRVTIGDPPSVAR
jgi:hypothetical protein